MIARMSLDKLPDFMADMPDIWLTQLEALFSSKGITDPKEKFTQVLLNIKADLASHVMGVMKDTIPEAERYDKFKEHVTNAYATSNEARLKQLIRGQTSGSRTPT